MCLGEAQHRIAEHGREIFGVGRLMVLAIGRFDGDPLGGLPACGEARLGDRLVAEIAALLGVRLGRELLVPADEVGVHAQPRHDVDLRSRAARCPPGRSGATLPIMTDHVSKLTTSFGGCPNTVTSPSRGGSVIAPRRGSCCPMPRRLGRYSATRTTPGRATSHARRRPSRRSTASSASCRSAGRSRSYPSRTTASSVTVEPS